MPTVWTTLVTQEYSFSLGVFDTESQAQQAFLKYLKSHEGFMDWLNEKKKEYFKEYGRKLKNLEDSIFDMEEQDKFWEANDLNFSILNLETGVLFEFYDWVNWIDNYETRNLYLLLKAVLEDTRFCVDIELMAKLYPLLPQK